MTRLAMVGAAAARVSRQDGYVLLPVVLAVVLVATAAFMMNHEGATNLRLLDNALEGQRAEYLAQAGLQHALWQAGEQGCGPYTELSNRPLGGGAYSTALAGGLGSTTDYSIAVDQDAWVGSDSPASNHGSDGTLKVRSAGGVLHRPLIRYDLSGLPAGAPVLSATAWFRVTGAHPQGAIAVRRVVSDWTEGGATWDNVGDQLETAVLTMIPPQPTAGVWVPVNLTAQVQAWVNGAANFGIALEPAATGVDGGYSSREGTGKPYLEVVLGTPPSTPVALTSTGTLASGTNRTVTRSGVLLYQEPVGVLHLQPGAAEGQDTMIYDWKSSWNYGAHSEIAVTGWSGSVYRGLLKFDLKAIPRGARVISAELALYQNSNGASGGPVGVRRVTSPWAEGTGNGGTAPGATWNQRDSGVAWSQPGGDFAGEVYSVTTVPTGTVGWVTWDLTGLVDDWVSGSHPNHGLALMPEVTSTDTYFDSSDASNTSRRPKLTVSYACSCDSRCLAPQGQGNILMVVINPTTLVPTDAYKKALFESWGYTVSVVGESANQATYDTAIAAADVVFVSETVNALQVGTKLKDVEIGVVTQDGIYNDDLGLASGAAWPIAATVVVADTSHYITAPFRPGPVAIYRAGMEQLNVSGTEAARLRTLVETAGAGALVVLEKGSTTLSGGSAAGRRVMLPLGRDAGLRWDYLTGDGLLLVQRALAWGMGADLAPPPPRKLLFVSGGSTVVEFPSGDLLVIPTAREQQRIDLIASWGYTVNLIADDDSQASFDAAVDGNDVAYVSSEVSETALAGKLVGAGIGVVNEHGGLVETFGFGQQSVGYKSRTEVDVVDNGHYITQPFGTGLLTIASTAQNLHIVTANKAAGFTALAQAFNTGSLWDDTLGVIEAGGELYGGGTAAGRRALLPWGDAVFDVTALTADGRTLMKRTIEWAEGAGAAPGYSVLLVVADPAALSPQDAARKALIESWGFKVELIDDADPQAGFDAAVAAADAAYVSETVDAAKLGGKLDGAAIGVVNEDPEAHGTFGFSTVRTLATVNDPLDTDASHYITSTFGGGAVTLFTAVQPVGAATGTLASGLDTIGTWSGGVLGSLGGLLTLDGGAALAGGGTAAGRRVQTPWSGQDGVSVTDITALTADGRTVMRRAIEWAAGADLGGGGGPACANRVADDFESGGYGGSSGTLPWAGDWLEVFESDGPSGGDEKIVSFGGSLAALVKDRGQGGTGEGLEREADLSAYASGTLAFDYWRDLGNNRSVTVQVSGDGGANWVDLATYVGSAADAEASPQSASFDISPYLGVNTRIRFMTGSNNGNGDGLYFDDLRICVEP